jgi:hypothetical protein
MPQPWKVGEAQVEQFHPVLLHELQNRLGISHVVLLVGCEPGLEPRLIVWWAGGVENDRLNLPCLAKIRKLIVFIRWISGSYARELAFYQLLRIEKTFITEVTKQARRLNWLPRSAFSINLPQKLRDYREVAETTTTQ